MRQSLACCLSIALLDTDILSAFVSSDELLRDDLIIILKSFNTRLEDLLFFHGLAERLVNGDALLPLLLALATNVRSIADSGTHRLR